MIIKSSEFVISAVSQYQYPQGDEREIVFVGRSNVGKSSLINKLLGRRKLAHISSNPGKTQTINFYHINESFYFVDLPGYGYAKVAKDLRSTWGPMIEEYFLKRNNLALVLMLVDIRHSPTKLDVTMAKWLQHIDRPFLVVATKADKLSHGAQMKNVSMIRKELGIGTSSLIMTSSETGAGMDQLWERIEQAIGWTGNPDQVD